MKLQKGNVTIELTDEIQIAAYKRAGYMEVKQTKSKRGGGDGEKDT